MVVIGRIMMENKRAFSFNSVTKMKCPIPHLDLLIEAIRGKM